MSKVSKILQCLFLCGFMCVMTPQNARALFGLTPPLDFDIEIDPGDDAGKLVSILEAELRKLQTEFNATNSLILESIKGGALAKIRGDVNRYKKGAKSPVKDVTEPYAGIEKGDVRETPFYNAFIKLFFTAPSGENVQAARMAYRQKAIEFKQDMIVDAYVAGRLTEDYLVLVEKTIRRLDRCQEGDRENCKFFGLEWADVQEGNPDNPPSNEDNPGNMGEIRNAYIVITIYDRLMRIVEDLAATEAMFQAARSIDLAKPVDMKGGDASSDASQYINKKYQFTHHQENETTYADVQGEGHKAKIENIQIAKILNKLQHIDNWQQNALALHNLKVKLPEYKAMYRKYLKAKEVHERTLRVLGECDTCAKTFLNTYNNGLTESWGDTKPVNDYAGRSGISKELIEKYQASIQQTIIETSENLCPGYYTGGICPSGYHPGDPCKIVTMVEVPDPATGNMNVEAKEEIISDFHECVMDTAQQDTDFGSSEEPSEDELKKIMSGQDDTDYLEDDVNAEEVRKDARIKSERAWRIGEEKLMKLTESHQLEFEPWNDQISMQEMYLRQKYHNMRLITLAIDEGLNSFKVGKDYMDRPGTKAEIISKLMEKDEYKLAKEMIRVTTRCKTAHEAQPEAYALWCTGYTECGCNVTASDDSEGILTGTKRCKKRKVAVTDKDGKIVGYRYPCDICEPGRTWLQEAQPYDDSRCYFTKAPGELPNKEACSGDGDWDLRAEFLVQNYLKAGRKRGNCIPDTEEAGEYLRTLAKNEFERYVAQDEMREIIELRVQQDEAMRKFVNEYDQQLYNDKQRLMGLKTDLGGVNVKIDDATLIKNNSVKERSRGDNRVKAIISEIGNLNNQLLVNIEQPSTDPSTGEPMHDSKQQCSLEVKIYKLKYEAHAICERADISKHKDCKDFASALEPWGEGSEGCKAVREKEAKEADKKATKKTVYEEDLKMIAKLAETTFIREAVEDVEDINERKGDSRQVKLVQSDAIIDKQEAKLIGLKAERDKINNEIKSLVEKIKAAARAFAKEYIRLAQEHQENLDKKNATFEKYLEESLDEDFNRMQRGRKMVCKRKPPFIGPRECEAKGEPYKDDNLASTLQNILYRGHSQLLGKDEVLWEGFDDTWDINNNAKVKDIALQVGVPPIFKAGSRMEGANTAELVGMKVRDKMANAASEVLADYIKEFDDDVRKERIHGEDLIKDWANGELELCIVGDCEHVLPSEAKLKEIVKHANYAKGAYINGGHTTLIADLRTPTALKKYGVTDLSKFYGIPKDSELYTIPQCEYKDNQGKAGACFRDDKYFVALPARGNNYVDKLPDDENAGRDFRAPQEPLLNLPPLREVFYFSTGDYDDMPREEDGSPSWTTFLNKKFVKSGWNDYPEKPEIEDDVAEWEYMPRTWLHILARPNMREDGLYQQSFEERPYGDGAIGDVLLKPGQKNVNYNIIVGRSGVYPCQLDSYIIDVAPGTAMKGLFIVKSNKASDMQFIRGKSIVANTPKCKEITLNKDTTTLCGIYNKKKPRNSVCHLLADHGMKNDKGEVVEDTQQNLGSGSSELYEKYSELGSLFEFNGNRINYRGIQDSIHGFLLSEENSDNDIRHQRVDRAAFTHSIFSTFLEAVNAEHNALKNLENTKKNLEDALFDLCRQIHIQKKKVGDYGDEYNAIEYDSAECDDECKTKLNEKCVSMIMDEGLATSADEDRVYGVGGEYDSKEYPDFNGINCAGGNANSSSDGSFYEELFCKLDRWKDEEIQWSRYGDGKGKRTNERGEEEVDTHVGFRNLGSTQIPEREAKFDVVTEANMSQVKERMQIIMNYDAAFEADKNEEEFLSATISTYKDEGDEPSGEAAGKAVASELKTERENRTRARESDEDAIRALGNQTQIVPYCPLYMNNRKAGL